MARLTVAGSSGRQAEAAMHRRLQPRLDALVVAAEHALEGRDHVADDVFRGVVQERGQSPARVGFPGADDLLDDQRVLRHRERMVAGGLAVPAGDAREPVRDVLDLDIERGGSRRSSRRPDSIRCQTRGGLAVRAAPVALIPRRRCRLRQSVAGPGRNFRLDGTPSADRLAPADSASDQAVDADHADAEPRMGRKHGADRPAARLDVGARRQVPLGAQHHHAPACRAPDAACARRPPARHSSPCGRTRRRSGRAARRAERRRSPESPARPRRCRATGAAPRRRPDRPRRRFHAIGTVDAGREASIRDGAAGASLVSQKAPTARRSA